MKLTLSILLSLLITNIVISQDVVISVGYQNSIITGIQNPLKVLAKNVDSDSLYLSTNNGEINNFTIIPVNLERTYISVNKITQTDTIEIDKVWFKPITIERYIEPTIRGESGNVIISKNALQVSKFSSHVVGLDFNLRFRIKEYRIIAIRDNTPIFTRMMHSDEITPELKNDMELLKSGDIVYYVDIIAKGYPTLYNVKPLKVIIK